MTDMSKAPSVSPERIQAFYQALSAMNMELDPDPLELGPKRLNAKTSECRTYLSRTERIFLEISQDLHWYKREHRRSQAAFELSVQDLMSNDPEVRAGRSVTDRLAVAHTKLRSERERISDLLFSIEDLEAVLVVVRTKRNDLKDIASRLRDQLKICQEEIGLGGRWGNYSRGSESPMGGAAGGLTEVEALLDGALAKIEEDAVKNLEAAEKGDLESDIDSLFDTSEGGKTLPSSQFTDSESDKALEKMGETLPKPVVIEPKKDPNLESILEGFE